MAFRFNNLTPEDKQTIIEHLEDMRKALIVSILALIAASIFCFSFSEQLLAIIAAPLSAVNQELIVTGVTEAFYIKLKLSLIAGFVISFPIIVLSLWFFLKPALYPHERKYIYILFPITMLLFAAGILFAYFGILRMALNFFIYVAGESLDTMFKVDQYVAFALSFTLPFGLVFEMPVIVFFLVKIGVINHEVLSKNRKYALLLAFIIGAFLTPPDPLSQVLMAVPMYVLYEASIVVAKLARRKALSPDGEGDVDAENNQDNT